ncbi:MAG: DCC1-like thiol-disulfide oxidoreductase family protein, partial [Patescibacteria group bacterium]
MQWLIKKIIILFGLDIRSLALLRIGTAILIIGECIHRAGDLVAHYSDAGVLPRTVLIDSVTNQWHISLNLISGLWQVQAVLLFISFFFACAMLVGWHTRIATFISWVLLLSFQARNPLISQNSDTVLRLVLFWALFLPWGAAASIDSLHKPVDPKHRTAVLTPATVAYIVQILLIYVFAVAFKTGPEWHVQASAVYFALNAGGFVSPLGVWLSQFTVLLPYITRGVMAFETWMPILFFIPFRVQTIRTILIISAIGMHLAMGLTLELGLFSWVMIVAFLGLLPGGVWDAIERRWRQYHEDCVLYYDGHCGFCNNSARIIAMFLFIPGLPVVTAQENKEILKYMEEKNSWVFVCNETKYTKSKAFFMLAKHSPVFGWLSWLCDRTWVRVLADRIYDWVSARRKKMCVNGGMIHLERPIMRWLGVVGKIFAAGCLIYVIVWNISTISTSNLRIAPSFQWIAQVFRLDQKWDMFSPFP